MNVHGVRVGWKGTRVSWDQSSHDEGLSERQRFPEDNQIEFDLPAEGTARGIYYGLLWWNPDGQNPTALTMESSQFKSSPVNKL